MKIAIIAEVADHRSGARVPIELSLALAEEKQTIFFYANEKGKNSFTIDKLKKKGVKIRLISNKKRTRLSRFIFPFQKSIRLWKQLQQDNPDLISTHCHWPFFFSALLSKKPIYLTYHGTQFNILQEKIFPPPQLKIKYLFLYCLDQIINFLIWLQTLFLVHSATKVIAISNFTQQELKTLYHRSSKRIYSGISSSFYTPPNQKINKNITKYNNKIYLLTISRFTPYKGFHNLIKIIQELKRKYPQIQLIIAGKTSNTKYTQYLLQNSSNTTIFNTNLRDQDINNLYQKAYIYLSADEYLFWGLPILEAASHSLPAISLNRCAATEVILDKKTGFIVNNFTEMKKKIILLLENPQLQKLMGKKAYQYSRQFSWQVSARNYLHFFSLSQHHKKQ